MNQIQASARALLMLTEAAELRGLPLPFTASVFDYSPTIDLQFHTPADVDAWAASIGATMQPGAHHEAVGELYDIPVRLVAALRQEALT